MIRLITIVRSIGHLIGSKLEEEWDDLCCANTKTRLEVAVMAASALAPFALMLRYSTFASAILWILLLWVTYLFFRFVAREKIRRGQGTVLENYQYAFGGSLLFAGFVWLIAVIAIAPGFFWS